MPHPTLRLTALALVASMGLLTGCGGDGKTETAKDQPAAAQTTGAKDVSNTTKADDNARKTKARQKLEAIEKPKTIPATLPVGKDADLPLPVTASALEKAGVESGDDNGVEVELNVHRLLSAAAGESKEEFGQRVVELLGRPDGAWTMAFYPGSKNEIEALQAHWTTADGGVLLLYVGQFLREDGSDPDVTPASVHYIDATVYKNWKSGEERTVANGLHHPERPDNKVWKPLELK